jgi:hypothetical protein
MYTLINKLTHIGDMLATPFFLLLVIYFYNMENKTPFENVLFLFSITGFLVDATFSYFYVFKFGKKK